MIISCKFFFKSCQQLLFIFVFALCFSGTAHAWVYSEHRDIALRAVEYLDAEHRADFNRLWTDGRSDQESRLCENAADSERGLEADCIDWAAYSAIAGDHSCSSREMLSFIFNEDWLLDVDKASAQLKIALANIPVEELDSDYSHLSGRSSTLTDQMQKQKNRAMRLNALRIADIKLLNLDPQYASRANSNTAHFLIARPVSNITGREYAKIALQPDSEINAIGVYAWYHIKALKKASHLANAPQLSTKQRQMISRSMLADEGFALHFLQDIFAAGHVAGTWGEVSQRLGTHNYYNQHGLEVYTWKKEEHPVVLMGDAHIREQDMSLAAKSISRSLQQVLDFAMGRDTGYPHPYNPLTSAEAEDFNVCTQSHFLQLADGINYEIPLTEVIIHTPMPGLGTALGALPRFRSEVGPFVGLAGSIDSRLIDGGFLDTQEENGYITGLDLSFRAGFGMDDIMGESGDGLVFASIGFRSDSASSNNFSNSPQIGSLSAAVPARSNISTRIRMPFYLFPTDLIWLSPLYLFNETAYTNMAVTAGNGGLIPWQQGIATSIGRFQFVLGREMGATFYGWHETDYLLIASENNTLNFTNIKSILVDFPILEYRPFRSFSSNQSSSVIFQLYSSVDIPQGNSTTILDGSTQQLDDIWSIGIRMVFDWRHY